MSTAPAIEKAPSLSHKVLHSVKFVMVPWSSLFESLVPGKRFERFGVSGWYVLV